MTISYNSHQNILKGNELKDKVKVIYLLCHQPNPIILKFKNPKDYFLKEEQGKFHILNYSPYWVGFFAKDHHAIVAKELLSETDEFEVECWRPYGYGLKDPDEEIVDGIKHRVFPASVLKIPNVGIFTWSSSLYEALKKEIQSRNVILNASYGHDRFNMILFHKLRKYKTRFGLLVFHRSSGFLKFSYWRLSKLKKIKYWYFLIENFFDFRSLKICDHYYSGSLVEAKYLKEQHPEINSSFCMDGIEFSNYRVLAKEEKLKLRKELGLPVNKNILIAHGNWRSNDYKYQHLIECYQNVKHTGQADNLQLVMIGGYKSEDLYEVGKKAGAIMIERCGKEDFVKYLEASDFFTKAFFDYSPVNFGGFGTSTIEALAVGIPVISNNIIHFPGSKEERNGIGIDMPTKEKLEEAIIYMNENYQNYTSTRELAKKYFNFENNRTIYANKYRELSAKYFNCK